MTEQQGSELGAALARVQTQLPPIGKGSTANIGQYKFKYADLADISAAVLPLLGANGLSWLTMPTLDEQGHFVLRYELLHASGESRVGFYPLPAATSKAQDLGSAITYARRYALSSMVGITPDEDDDGQSAPAAPARQQRPAPQQRQAPAAAERPATRPTVDEPTNGHPAGQDTPEAARGALMEAAKSLGYTLPEVGKAYFAEHKTSIAQETDAVKIREFTADLREKAAKIDAEAKAKASA